MKKYLLSLAVLGLMAGSSMGAYQVNQAGWAPTGPLDVIWDSANVMPSTWTDGGSTGAADMTLDVRFLWDTNRLYARVMVTDDVHSIQVASGNAWNDDSMEFYVNAKNVSSTTFVAADRTTQDQVYFNNAGVLTLDTADSKLSSTTAQAIAWNDFGSNGNYAIQMMWDWAGTGAGQLGLAGTPSVGDPMRLGGGANDDDTGVRNNHAISQNFAGSGAITWNNPSTYYASQISNVVAPEPATLALLALGGIGTLIRRRRRA
jgi:hypothetical protein